MMERIMDTIIIIVLTNVAAILGAAMICSIAEFVLAVVFAIIIDAIIIYGTIKEIEFERRHSK